MLDFQMFRLKVYPTDQRALFQGPEKPSDILKEVLKEASSAELRKGHIWHTGNITKIDERGYYLRVGRTTKSTIEVYEGGNFIDQEFETAPYTHAIIDVNLEVLAIAKKPRLTPKALGIAKRFVRLLNEAPMAKHLLATFEVSAITNPDDFIEEIKRAYSISRFWVKFSKPNPFDVEKDFIEPQEKLLRATDAEKGKTELVGKNMNADSLEAIARSAASSGDDAGAWYEMEESGPLVRRSLKENPVIIKERELDRPESRLSLLTKIRNAYRKIRGKENENDNT